MSDVAGPTRSEVRRVVALLPACRRRSLGDKLGSDAVLGPLPRGWVIRLFRDYLLDPAGRAIGDGSEESEAWIDGSLLVTRLSPGNAVPLSDELAAILVGPSLSSHDGSLARSVDQLRYSPRADDAVACAMASVEERPLAARELRRLADTEGPDEPRLHLSLLQAGRALAWADDRLLDEPGMSAIVERLCKLLCRESPRTLLSSLAKALGPIAASPTAAGEQVRKEAQAVLAAAWDRLRAPRSTSALTDEESAVADRRLCSVAAEILGRAAPSDDRARFEAHRRLVLEGRSGALLLPPFLDGLVAAAAIGPLVDLVKGFLPGNEVQQLLALQIASQVPVDACAAAVVRAAESPSVDVRYQAIGALSLLPVEVALPSLTALLADPSPAVCFRAAQAVRLHGRDDLLAATDGARSDENPIIVDAPRPRRSLHALVARAARPTFDEATAAALIGAVLSPTPVAASDGAMAAGGEAEAEAATGEAGALVEALGSFLRTSKGGLAGAAALVSRRPESRSLVARALATAEPGAEASPIALPDEARATVERALLPALDAGGGAAEAALLALCRLSSGHEPLVEKVARALLRPDAEPSALLIALSDLGVRSDEAAAALRPFLDDASRPSLRLLAVNAAGRVVAAEHPLRAALVELAGGGGELSDAVHAALEAIARATPPPPA